jgi:hypothetical protein
MHLEANMFRQKLAFCILPWISVALLLFAASGCSDASATPPVTSPAMDAGKPTVQSTPAVTRASAIAPATSVKSATANKSTNFNQSDFDRHVVRLKTKLGDEPFTILIQPPFVVIGDEPADRVQERATNTVKWAVDHLKQLYFDRDPAMIIDIWLFADRESYEAHAEKFFGAKPHTPYGYYSPQHRALVMNIATGGGTLVHEIVHPFIAANFPECPSWFNEGLASLYEQSGEAEGKIVGYVNWRLNDLQQTIRAGRLQSFEDLCGTTTDQFYNHDSGANYGQARYLCLYLQQRDLLQKFYREFHDHVKTDATGYATLQIVLRERDMSDFQKRWETWVLSLRRD